MAGSEADSPFISLSLLIEETAGAAIVLVSRYAIARHVKSCAALIQTEHQPSCFI